MKRLLIASLAVWLSCRVCAGPIEDAVVAVMRLSERPNYTWVATIDDDARSYDIIGRTSPEGYTLAKMPLINSIRRRLGRSAADNQADVVFRGNVDCVIATDEGWKSVAELPVSADGTPVIGTSGLTLQSAALAGPLGTSVRGGRGGVTMLPAVDPKREQRAYSNLQLGVSHPHEELGVMVTCSGDLAVDENMITGTLTDLGAQLLLVRDGQNEITPVHASGSFKIWLRGGRVERYQVNLEGVLDVKTGLSHRQIQVHQSAHTVVKDVGTTKFEVPDEARRKLQ